MHRVAATFFTAVIFALFVSSCREPTVRGEGDSKTDDRSTAGAYDHIEISGPVDGEITVTASSAPSIKLEGFANILPYIKTKVEDNTLKIYVEDEVRVRTKKNIIARISLPSLAGVSVAGKSDVHIAGNVTGEQLELDIAGSGSIKVDALNTTSLDVSIAGSNNLNIGSGTVTTASYDIAGSGEIHAFNLNTTDTDLEIAGMGEAEVTASGKLDISVGGKGNVKYKGQPVVTKDIAGSGSVEHVN